jgi:hypothetical protein
MSPSASLLQIARERNWMEFAVRLEAAMAQPDSHGMPDAAAVRAAVARFRRQLPSTLTIALKAMQFLRDRHGEVLEARDARIGCAPVRLLARIAELSPAAEATLAPQVFARTIRQADLQAHYVALRQDSGGSLSHAA